MNQVNKHIARISEIYLEFRNCRSINGVLQAFLKNHVKFTTKRMHRSLNKETSQQSATLL